MIENRQSYCNEKRVQLFLAHPVYAVARLKWAFVENMVVCIRQIKSTPEPVSGLHWGQTFHLGWKPNPC